MMGRINHDQGQLFYSFSLGEVVPDDHLVRKIAAVLNLSWVHAELAPHYPNNGRPSIDLELMIRMLIIGYPASHQALCGARQCFCIYTGVLTPDAKLPTMTPSGGHETSRRFPRNGERAIRKPVAPCYLQIAGQAPS
jgi:hypothetical protein